MSTSRRTVLVALDASSRREPVLAKAVELSAALDADLVLVHAVGVPAEAPREARNASPDELLELLATSAREDLAARASTLESSRVRIRVEVGVPADVIARVAEDVDAYLVVVGSHGYSRLERMLGTTATRVVNHVSRTVVVVKNDG